MEKKVWLKPNIRTLRTLVFFLCAHKSWTLTAEFQQRIWRNSRRHPNRKRVTEKFYNDRQKEKVEIGHVIRVHNFSPAILHGATLCKRKRRLRKSRGRENMGWQRLWVNWKIIDSRTVMELFSSAMILHTMMMRRRRSRGNDTCLLLYWFRSWSLRFLPDWSKLSTYFDCLTTYAGSLTVICANGGVEFSARVRIPDYAVKFHFK